MLYMALRLFGLYIDTLIKTRDPNSGLRVRFDEEKSLKLTQRFWHVLWDRRTTFFHTRLMRAYVWIPCDEDPVYFSGAVADCLVSIENLWDRVQR